MRPINNLTGATFDRLTVISPATPRLSGGRKRAMWLCECACGNLHKALHSNLVSNQARSCGCLKDEQRRARRKIPKKRSVHRLWSEDVEEFLSS